jgi:hypothetical protein
VESIRWDRLPGFAAMIHNTNIEADDLGSKEKLRLALVPETVVWSLGDVACPGYWRLSSVLVPWCIYLRRRSRDTCRSSGLRELREGGVVSHIDACRRTSLCMGRYDMQLPSSGSHRSERLCFQA